jgi:anti-sigma factor RsiW
MSAEWDGTIDRRERLLHAYHDGELSRLARWRFERQLRRSPELQRELAGLRRLGDALRAREAGRATPDVWDALALRLPAEDARRAERGAAGAARAWGARESWWLKPVGALAVSAVLVAALLLGDLGSEPPAAGGVVRWIDSGSRSVMVLDDQPDTTIIWVFDGAVEGASWGIRSEQA